MFSLTLFINQNEIQGSFVFESNKKIPDGMEHWDLHTPFTLVHYAAIYCLCKSAL